MTTSASLIGEESKKQCSAILEVTGNLTFNLQRFLMMSQNGITLTVWRIVPITRSLVFGITGMLLTYTVMFYSLSPVKAMTTSASLIAEESKKQSSEMPEATGNLTFAQQRFLMMSQNGIAFTVWRIVPITRSLIFGITGMLLTYTVMFYSLSPVKGSP
ncbi:hypothetical protein CDAR_210311 [Caerostris darwini]|uniref:Uncharacterized protein n=1 Tax=Caerostris darwini TaxID=1538125 RepID=A0AAV4TAT7_9ARAC|nr:hypothetical protein CDAR_210311 [Caerostris darwini]